MAVNAFGLLIPIRPGQDGDIRRAVDALPSGDHSPFAAVPGTHVARLVVIGAFGGPAAALRRLHPPLLFLSALVDGRPDEWLRGMCQVLDPTGGSLWTHCAGWPGADPASTAEWLADFQIRMDLSIVGNPGASVGDVDTALQRRSNLLALALEARQLSPAELRHRYQTTVQSVDVEGARL